jgi:hypothetical protein
MNCTQGTDSVLQAFRLLCISVGKVANVGYGFLYNNLYMLYLPTKQDRQLIRIAVPKICKDNACLNDVVNMMNLSTKYINFSVLGDDVWAIYEHHIFGGTELTTIISHMLNQLSTAVFTFQNEIITQTEFVTS